MQGPKSAKPLDFLDEDGLKRRFCSFGEICETGANAWDRPPTPRIGGVEQRAWFPQTLRLQSRATKSVFLVGGDSFKLSDWRVVL